MALAELILYGILAVASSWPLAAKLSTTIPLGTEATATVPLFNMWTVWWNADRARHGYRGYWDAPIFHPTKKTFALSETQPPTAIAAPVLWATDSRAAAYNVYLLAMLTLNGWSAFLLLRCLKLNWLPAVLGGALVLTLPFTFWRLGVLQLIPLAGIIWTIHALYLFGERPSFARGALIGAAFALAYHLCNYYGLFFSLLLVLSGWLLLGRQLLRWRAWTRLLPGLALALLLVLPLAQVQRHVSQQHNWRRSEESVANLSAELADYSIAPGSRIEWPSLADPKRQQTWPLGAGYEKYALALVGIACGVFDRGRRRWTLFALAFLTASLLCSLGPKLTLGSWVPYRSLMNHVPGFAYVRSPYRFAVFVQLTVALLGGVGLHYVSALARRSRSKRVVPALAVLLVGVAAVSVTWPRAARLYALPEVEQDELWMAWLRENTPNDTVIVCLPFVKGPKVAEFLDTVLWMHSATYHRRVMVSGYSGYFPESFFELQAAMRSFPDDNSIRLLRRHGVRYCVVRHTLYPDGPPAAWFDVLRHVYLDENAAVDVYEIRN